MGKCLGGFARGLETLSSWFKHMHWKWDIVGFDSSHHYTRLFSLLVWAQHSCEGRKVIMNHMVWEVLKYHGWQLVK